LLQPNVWKILNWFVAASTLAPASFELINAYTAVALSTASRLVGLSEHLKTHWTLTLEGFWRLHNKFAIKSTFMTSLLRHLVLVRRFAL
jgi:hypothetical protein